MTENERVEFIHTEIMRLIGTDNYYVSQIDVYPERGIVSVELYSNSKFVRGYAKQCRYAPHKDEWDEKVGLSVATADALHRAGIPFVTGSARKNNKVKMEWTPVMAVKCRRSIYRN